MTDLELLDTLGTLTTTQFERVLLLLEVEVALLPPATVAPATRALELFPDGSELAETIEPLATLEIHAPLHCCAITPDSKTILAGDAAGALHILDWRPGRT